MIIHKTIETLEAAVYLPFALAKLRWLAANADYSVAQTYIIDDVTVRIQHLPFIGQQYAKLSGGNSIKYEFFTSDAITSSGTYCSPGYNDPVLGPFVMGHATALKPFGVKLRPSMLASYDRLNDAPVLDLLPASTALPQWVSRRSFNDQKVAFAQEYLTTSVKVGADKVLYTTTPAAGQQMLQHNPSSPRVAGLSSIGLSPDIGWDIRNPVYQNHKLLDRVQPLLPPPYWWRRGTVIQAKDSDGALHPIKVVTDSMSNFYFFRLNLPKSELLNASGSDDWYAPSSKVKKISAASFLPSWVETPTVDTASPWPTHGTFTGAGPVSTVFATTAPYPYTPSAFVPGGDAWVGAQIDDTIQNCEYLWTFHPDGTEASAIVHENKGAAEYVVPGTSTVNPVRTMRWGFGNLWIPSAVEAANSSYFAGHGGLQDVDVRVRGLLSVGISVSVTGDGLTDFIVSVTPKMEIRGRHYVDVAYAMARTELLAKGVHRGDLLTSELELFGATPYGLYADRYNLLTVRNTTAGVESAPLIRWRMDAFSSTLPAQSSITVTDYGSTAVKRATIFSPMGTYTYSYLGNSVVAADLKSLSFVVAVTGTTGVVDARGSRGLHLFLYGALAKQAGNIGVGPITDFPDASTLFKLPVYPSIGDLYGVGGDPYDFYEAYSAGQAEAFTTRAPYLLTVHPEGHYAAYATTWMQSSTMPVDPVIDVIGYWGADTSGVPAYIETTHAQMFNAAFSQSRQYMDYQYGNPFAVGVFATAGVWV
jgi:hypothetical protein